MGKNILVLCHGNINRSPACAAVLRDALVRMEPSFYTVTSAGFINPGRRAAKKMREAMLAMGYDLSQHRSQLVTPEMLQSADIVVYMDGGNARRIVNMMQASNYRMCGWRPLPDKCVNLGKWSVPVAPKVPDPAFMKKDSPEFAAVVEQLVLSSRALAKQLLERGSI
jgi:protein-tyrosine-phosphatase